MSGFGRDLGVVTTVAAADGAYLAMGLLRREAEVGAEVVVDCGEGTTVGTVLDVPLGDFAAS